MSHLSTRETQAIVGDAKGKMPGGKAVSNENITLVRDDIRQMVGYEAPMEEWWGDINLAKAFRTEFAGEGRRSHQTH